MKARRKSSYARIIYGLGLVAGFLASFIYSKTISFSCGHPHYNDIRAHEKPEKEGSLSNDIGSGSVLRSKLGEKGKSLEARKDRAKLQAKESTKDPKFELEKDTSKENLI
jgi:hypothetical protein